jgi:excisionase family DNA binding protein
MGYTEIINLPYLYEARGGEMDEIINDKWIGIDEAADYLGIKPVTLRGWIRTGKKGLPVQKIGKQWKFKKSELDAWVKSGESAD